MITLSNYIQDGAMAFLKREYRILTIFVLVLFIILSLTIDIPRVISF